MSQKDELTRELEALKNAGLIRDYEILSYLDLDGRFLVKIGTHDPREDLQKEEG